MFDLSLQGRRTQAGQRLAYSIMHHRPEYARSRAISQTKLATLMMATGDPRRAAAVGNAALDVAGGLRSKRAVDDLRELRQLGERHSAIAEVRELGERIADVWERA